MTLAPLAIGEPRPRNQNPIGGMKAAWFDMWLDDRSRHGTLGARRRRYEMRRMGLRALVRRVMEGKTAIMSDAPGPILDVTPGDHEGFERGLLEGTGHPVMVCHGPGAQDYCPLLEEGSCDEVNRAHGVVFKLDLDREYHRRILEAYKETIGDDVPIAASVKPGQEETYAHLLESLFVWSHSPNAAELDGFAALVEAAERSRPDEQG